jgi:nucleoid-associated protein YgaU
LDFDLKKFLKKLKLNENNISTVLGILVVVIVGILVVNYFRDKRAGTLTGLNTQNQNTDEHIVVKGETLWSVSEDAYGSGYNWVDIKEANALSSDTIEVGQKLTLPDVAAKMPTSTKAIVKAPATQTISGESYTVVRGDCLWNIAVRTYGDGFKWVEIAKANKLVNPDLIHAGNVLILPR